MQNDEAFSPKLFLEDTEEDGTGIAPVFADYTEIVSERIRRTGTILFLSDGENADAFRSFYGYPCGVFVQISGDCLPLFSRLEDVSCVIAVGGETVMRSARFYAGVNRAECLLVPADARQIGAWEERGEVALGEKKMTFPLAEGTVVLDGALLERSMSTAWARIALARLALFEARALSVLAGKRGRQGAFGAIASEREALLMNAAIVRSGLCGEGFTLARLLASDGERCADSCAFNQLLALYAAFFKRGYPRKAFTPDYGLRLALAGVGGNAPASEVPDLSECVARMIAFERMRGALLRELHAVRSQSELPAVAVGPLTRLKFLPEYHPNGLCGVLREFGLMEWDA